MVEKDIIDIFLAIIQIVTLIALIIYVAKTWEIASASTKSTKVSEGILKEMKESRDTEVAPYVVVYFDIPYGKHLIYLVIKNIGKSVANNVKLVFQPSLKNRNGERINDMSFIKEGIGSSYFNQKDLPFIYKVNVSYSGGLHSESRTIEQIMDLSAFKGITLISDKGMNELVTEVEKLVQHNGMMVQNLVKIANYSANGIWLKNPDFLITGLQLNQDAWASNALAKLIEFKTLWMAIYGANPEKLVNPFLADLINRSDTIGSQLLIITSRAPLNIPSELTNHLVEIAVKLSELGDSRFYIDGGDSENSFDMHGNQIITFVDKAIKQIKLQYTISNDSE